MRLTSQYKYWALVRDRRPSRLLGSLRREADESRWDLTGLGRWVRRAGGMLKNGYICLC